jgi:hypothetical protein
VVSYDDDVNDYYVSVFKAVIGWVCERLDIPDNIEIKFYVDDLSGEPEGQLRGYVICDPDCRTLYDIYIDCDMDRGTIISTVMHEMVHVYQHINYRELDEDYAYSFEYVLYYDFMIDKNGSVI